ncbi:MAG: Acetylglutamate kinase [Elusimicrobia bacterium ADurb.Bin231]|nr:MAG: Acetylglutamate kinase [Elusimicrobia bacterium ADurb.Bin231]
MKKKTIVVKYGGSLMDNKIANGNILKRISEYSKKCNVLVVHGGGKAITKEMEKAGIKPKFVNGLRYTGKKSIKIVRRVLENLQKNIAGILKNAQAVGGITRGRRIKELGYVGKFAGINKKSIEKNFAEGKICVMNCLGNSANGDWLNMNADDVASGIATAIKADRLVFFTDVSGVLDKNGKTIKLIYANKADELFKKGIVSGGMIPKLKGCLSAVIKGVREVDILDSNSKGTKIL